MVSSRRPPQLGRGRGQRPFRAPPPPRSSDHSQGRGARPWRQWHAATSSQSIAPLEVSSPKRPQWGRYIYLAIVLALFAVAARAAYDSVFWLNTQGMISGQQHNVAPVQTVAVKDILVRPSEQVEMGQALVALDSPELVQALVRSEADIARLRSEFLNNGVSVENTLETLRGRVQSLETRTSVLEEQYARERRQFESMRQLVWAGGAQAGHLDTLETKMGQTLAEYREAEAELAAARRQMLNLQQSLQQQSDEMILSTHLESLQALRLSIKEQLDHLDLRAPVRGVVAQVPVSRGDVLTAGDPAVVLVDNSELRAYLYFPPAAQSRLVEGMQLRVAAPSGEQIPLRVSSIYPAMDRLPLELQNQHRPHESAVVVEAVPADGNVFPGAMRSGTPVEGRIPRWPVVTEVENRLRNLVSGIGRAVANLHPPAQGSTNRSRDDRQ